MISDTLGTMYDLAVTLYESDKYQEGSFIGGKSAFQKSLDIFGPKHTLTIGSCDFLGRCYESQGRYGDALAVYYKLLGMLHADKGAEDSAISKIQGWIDGVHGFMKEEQVQENVGDEDEAGTSFTDKSFDDMRDEDVNAENEDVDVDD